MKILVIHGPNLNLLGRGRSEIYGDKTLDELNTLIQQQAKELGVEAITFQSNSEGSLIDFIQSKAPEAGGIIVNPGALTHYGLSLRDALWETNLPMVEVHITNIYSREDFRHESVIAPIAKGQICGLGWKGYLIALKTLTEEL